MQITIAVDLGEDISAIDERYPNEVVKNDCDGCPYDEYWMGDPSDDDDFSYDEAVRAIGWIEGRIESAVCCLGDSGPWAMKQLRKTDEYQRAYYQGQSEAD